MRAAGAGEQAGRAGGSTEREEKFNAPLFASTGALLLDPSINLIHCSVSEKAMLQATILSVVLALCLHDHLCRLGGRVDALSIGVGQPHHCLRESGQNQSAGERSVEQPTAQQRPALVLGAVSPFSARRPNTPNSSSRATMHSTTSSESRPRSLKLTVGDICGRRAERLDFTEPLKLTRALFKRCSQRVVHPCCACAPSRAAESCQRA